MHFFLGALRVNALQMLQKTSLFCLFVALRPKSTAMVMAWRSVHLTTLFFLDKLEQVVNQYFVHILSLVTDNNPSWISGRRRMTVEIISWSISAKVWDRAGIELATPGMAARHASVVRHVTDCATRLLCFIVWNDDLKWNWFVTHLRHDKTNKMSVSRAKTQISRDIRPIWPESLPCA